MQRVPVTESQGRVHTSSATVTVLPEAGEVEVKIDPAGLEGGRLQVDRARWAVSQHHRLGGPGHPRTDRDCRRDARREEPAAEPGEGHAGAAGASSESRTGPPGCRAIGGKARPGRWRWALGEGADLQLQGEPGHRPPDKAHACTSSTVFSTAISTSSSTRLSADEHDRAARRNDPRYGARRYR